MAEVPVNIRVAKSGSFTIPGSDGSGVVASSTVALNGSETAFLTGKITGGGVTLSSTVHLLFSAWPPLEWDNPAREGESSDIITLDLKFVAGATCVVTWTRRGSAAGAVGVDYMVLGVV